MNYCLYCMRPVNGSYCPHCKKDISWEASFSQLPATTVLRSAETNRQYLTGAVLGQGGFGITYIALDLISDRRVAVKECFPTQAVVRHVNRLTVEPKKGAEVTYGKVLDRFVQEAQLLKKQAGNPSVVKVTDSFRANNTAYIVMEFLDGLTLQQKMRRDGKFSAAELLPRLKVLMQNLEIVHAGGIIHRDITPDNIMWMPDGRLVLIDFGSARAMGVNREMSVLLKHEFAPVEQYQKKGQGPWTDIYALCATVYYCLTGIIPPQAIERLEQETIESPSKLGADLTKEQEEALLWGLAVQPGQRPQNMGSLTAKLFSEETESAINKQAKMPLTMNSKGPSLPAGQEESGNNLTDAQKNKAFACSVGILALCLIILLILKFLI